MKNSDLNEESGILQFFSLYKRWIINILTIKEIEKDH